MTRRYRGSRGSSALSRKTYYDAFMESTKWRNRREQWISDEMARTGVEVIACAVCGQPWREEDDLHHVDYRRLATEAHTDLIPLHRQAHDRVHDMIDALHLTRAIPLPLANRHILQKLRDQNFNCATHGIKLVRDTPGGGS